MSEAEALAQVQDRLIERARADEAVFAAAFTGSLGTGDADRWSDVDVALGVDHPPESVAAAWTEWLATEFGILHHWDLPAPDARVIRVYLLANGVEVDVSFLPSAEYGARGPSWRSLFGPDPVREPFPAPRPYLLVGLAWHHVRHVRVCLERGRLWQAEHWLGALRTQVISLACLRLGLPTEYAKGAHLLPEEFTQALEPTLPRSLAAPEISRALSALVTVLVGELEHSAPETAAKLAPALSHWADFQGTRIPPPQR
ncbi:nucleotidyltransferase domain-containing protein [Nocardiopsis metallicus]|uniref:Nucleotidyltransferase domain-containing protein n=1 Tax=Nocardiopsis metallicus TaxID=179819 RepID=A0A840VYX1_9ACTN|nr:nucleotidyltransferase domain-containing protein [Nocardiopsis metallicus]MBB5489012.1 hypothetical protein [Nocardiopsis metallicus]